MADHPYRHLPDRAFWSRAVARPPVADVDPVGSFPLKISRQTKVATAGSCFAQHIARVLQESGFNYYVAEAGHPILPPALARAHNYGLFSARYGNIYTARQLLQLAQRAFGQFEPVEPAWHLADGSVVDPFRPTVQPRGFIHEAEMLHDRKQHLACVRRLFETLDVFVFTLGLTECWRSRADGAVFPVCPGVEGGEFDPERYEFLNQSVGDVIADLTAFVDMLSAINPKAQIVLTVSPVPLAATATPGENVLVATTYSKSVLRVAAGEMQRKYSHIHYFPSYEIITGAFSRGAYYASDLRNVTEAGVAHVMRLFLRHAASASDDALPAPGADAPVNDAQPSTEDAVKDWVDVMCDEAGLDS